MENIELTDSQIAHPLELKNSYFQSPVTMIRLTTSSFISFNGSRFDGEIRIDSTTIAGELLMSEDTQFTEVELVGTTIGGQLGMIGATFDGKLRMDSTKIGRDLIMSGAQFKEVVLVGTTIGGQLSVNKSTFDGKLDLTRSQIEDEIFLVSTDESEIVWKSAGSRVGPKLILRNTKVGELHIIGNSWLNGLENELEGFTYEKFGTLGNVSQEMLHKRHAKRIIEWLEMDKTYSFQPYWQLAQVLRNSGQEGMANDILFSSRMRERKETQFWSEKMWLWLLEHAIGYGYGLRMFYVLKWAIVILFIGVLFLFWGERTKKKENQSGHQLEFWGKFWYSLDMFLPVIRLREQHYDRELTGVTQIYFYFHKLFGYLIVFFVIAGLTGLTK